MKLSSRWPRCLTGGVLLACALHHAAAASLRARATAQVQPSVKPQAAAGAAPTNQQHRSKLDVGFSDFERNLTSEVMLAIQGMSASKSEWRKENVSERLSENLTATLKAGLKAELAPVKLSIGKTWMALPQPSQKDEYVKQLRNAFTSVFESSMKSFHSHLDLSIHRVENDMKRRTDDQTAPTPAELLARSEQTLGDSLVKEHCYENNLKTPKAKKSLSRRFCIQSVVGALAHRLNDTQGLISMSMRFDAGAMSLAQKQHKGVNATQK
mmetsp:Transcript_111286/g.208669  ORF Transcript_111286/g.208669 Transcript_111286/m.208669 type:complete len:268 (+) Transcript_111286:118-921(+)